MFMLGKHRLLTEPVVSSMAEFLKYQHCVEVKDWRNNVNYNASNTHYWLRTPNIRTANPFLPHRRFPRYAGYKATMREAWHICRDYTSLPRMTWSDIGCGIQCHEIMELHDDGDDDTTHEAGASAGGHEADASGGQPPAKKRRRMDKDKIGRIDPRCVLTLMNDCDALIILQLAEGMLVKGPPGPRGPTGCRRLPP